MWHFVYDTPFIIKRKNGEASLSIFNFIFDVLAHKVNIKIPQTNIKIFLTNSRFGN